jgi:Ser/Thr protein kinase RdoA (MazF antagonist)
MTVIAANRAADRHDNAPSFSARMVVVGDRRHPNQRSLASLPPELRRTTVPVPVRAWIERATQRRITSVRRLPGASSAAVHALALDDGQRVVLRRYVWPGYLAVEPDAIGREVDALQFAGDHGLPVARLIAVDLTGDDVGDGIPVVLMTRLAGRAVAVPDLHELARAAATIHAVDASTFPHEHFAWYADTTVVPPPDTSRSALWERAIETWHDARPRYTPTFIHRDFHPGNVLWSRGALSGIVDWANACRGPRGCDVAHCCTNLRALAGEQAADAFRAEYEAITGIPHDPYWDIASILEHGPSYFTLDQLSDCEPRLERALAALGRTPT